MGAGASARPSDDVSDETLRARIAAYEQEIAALEEAGDAALEALAWARYVYGARSRAAAAWAVEFAEMGVTPPPAG